VYRLAPSEPPSGRLQALHGFNILLGAATLALCYLVAREVFSRAPLCCSVSGGASSASHWLALMAPGVLVGLPMFAATSAAVNNDNLANVVGALLTFAAVRVPLAGPGNRWPAALGLVLGLGVLTKLTLAVFVPIVLAALAVRSARHGDGTAQFAREVLLMLGLMLLVLSPWLVGQGLAYGWDDPLAARRRIDVLGGRAFPSDPLSYLPYWSERLFNSGWGLFGWMQVQAPDKLYQVWAAVTQVALAGLLFTGARAVPEWKSRGLDPRPALLVAIVAAALGVVLYFNLTIDVQPQGRYLFVALAALAPLFVLGWAVLLPARARVTALGSLALGLVALNVYTLERVVRPGFFT
jgi:4-amino-4-deoxy-L-arabinose transferase-like glycosyltransferase